MKGTFRRTLAMLLSVVMVLSMVPGNMFAFTSAAVMGNDQTKDDAERQHYVDPANVDHINADGSVNTANSAEISENGYDNNSDTENEVTVTKSIEHKTDENGLIENAFDITLTVTTPEIIEDISKPLDSAVVLTLDFSGSMQNDSSNTDIVGANSYVDDMIVSTLEFIDTYADTGTNDEAERWLSFSTYGTHAHAVSDENGVYWFDVADDDQAAAAKALVTSFQAKKKMNTSKEGIDSTLTGSYLVRYDKTGSVVAVLAENEGMLGALKTAFAAATNTAVGFDVETDVVFDADAVAEALYSPITVSHHGGADGNTMTQGGLIFANSLLNSHLVADIDNKSIILMADGDGYQTNDNIDPRNANSSIPFNDVEYNNPDHDNIINSGSSTGGSYSISTSDKELISATLDAINDNGFDVNFVLFDTYNTPAISTMGYITNHTDGYFVAEGDPAFSALVGAYEAAISSISTSSQPWIVTDPMAPYITWGDYMIGDALYEEMFADTSAKKVASFDPATGNLTWDLASVADLSKDAKDAMYNEKTNTYTLKYTVTLDSSYVAPANTAGVQKIEEGKFYPTNGVTTLNYVITTEKTEGDVTSTTILGQNGSVVDKEFMPNDGVTDEELKPFVASFDVPSVEAFFGSHTFTKIDAISEEGLNGATFAVYKTNGEGGYTDNDLIGVYTSQTVDGKKGVVTIPNELAVGSYVMLETREPDITEIDGERVKFVQSTATSSFDVAWGDLTVTMWPVEDSSVFPNDRDEYEVERIVSKGWMTSANPEFDYSALEIEVALYKASDVTVEKNTEGFEISRTANAGTTPVATVILTAANNWTDTFGNHASFDVDGNPISYLIIEQSNNSNYVPTYGTATFVPADMDGEEVIVAEHFLYGLTNTVEVAPINIPVTKTFIVPEGIVPPSVTFTLTRQAEGESEIDADFSKTLTLTVAEGMLTVTDMFENLPVYNTEGKVYTYTVTETVPNGYTVVYTDKEVVANVADDVTAGFDVTNLHGTGTTSLSGTKTWFTEEVMEVYPEITVTLTIDGVASQDANHTATLNTENGYDYSFGDLPLYKWLGVDINQNDMIDASEVTGFETIVYSITEDFSDADWYDPIVAAETSSTDINITNTYRGNVSVYVTKNWNGVDGVTVEYTLMQDGQVYDANGDAEGGTVTVEITGSTTDPVLLADGLPKYKIGTAAELHEYGVREEVMVAEGDDSTYYRVSRTEETDQDGNLIVSFSNDILDETKIAIEVEKSYKQPTGFDKPEVTIELYRYDDMGILGNAPIDSIDLPKTIEVDGQSVESWTHTFEVPSHELVAIKDIETGEPTGEFDQVQIEYYIVEKEVPNGYWVSYLNEDGTEYEGEVGINEYISESTSIIVQNERDNTELVDVTVNKSWTWSDSQTKPESVEFELLIETIEGGETVYTSAGVANKILDTATETFVTFEDLPMYADDHSKISYWVKEVGSGTTYVASITKGETAENGDQELNVNNSLIQINMPISVEKNWFKPSDVAAQDVVITLYQNGEAVATVDILAAEANTQMPFVPVANTDGSYPFGYIAGTEGQSGGWPKYDIENGSDFVYTIVETTIPSGFSTSAPADDALAAQFGDNTVTNSFNHTYKDLEATKNWVGPATTNFPAVEFTLYSYTTDIDDAKPVVDGQGNIVTAMTAGGAEPVQKAEFKDLPNYDSQMNKINYYAVETSETPAYTMDEQDLVESPFEVTNRIAQVDLEIEVNKVWEMNGNEDDTPPESVEVQLYLGDTPVDADPSTDEIDALTRVLSEENIWTASFDGLDRYNTVTGEDLAGKYRIVEINVPDAYKSESTSPVDSDQDGIFEVTVTNSYQLYRYRVTLHYKATIDGVVTVNDTLPQVIVELTEAERNALAANTFTVTNPTDAMYTDYGIYTYGYDALQGNDNVMLELPGVLYEIDLFYEYVYNTPERPDREDPPDDPDPDDPDDPDDPTPPVEDIPDPEVPLVDLPEPEVPLVDLPDPEVPLAEIPEVEVPLAVAPETGDDSNLRFYIGAAAASGLLLLFLTRKKEEEAAE